MYNAYNIYIYNGKFKRTKTVFLYNQFSFLQHSSLAIKVLKYITV